MKSIKKLEKKKWQIIVFILTLTISEHQVGKEEEKLEFENVPNNEIL